MIRAQPMPDHWATPEAIRYTREHLGLTPPQLGALLGYSGEAARNRVSELEHGRRSPGGAVSRLLWAFLNGYRPAEWPEDPPERVKVCRACLGSGSVVDSGLKDQEGNHLEIACPVCAAGGGP
jgi:hypothetical protein